MTDALTKYLTADRSTRIQTLQLDQAWQTGLAHQHLCDEVVALLGELAAACVLLAGSIKFEGSVVLQLQGNGAVRLIMVECTSALELRATAQMDEACTLPDAPGLQTLLNADGQGRFVVMLDPEGRKPGTPPYQGIVPLEGESVAQVLEHYMRHSEQLETRLWLAADRERCAGLLLQRMPAQDDSHADERNDASTWTHCTTLADTLKAEELAGLPAQQWIHRLFWQEDLLTYPAQAVRWHCSCSRERVAHMLRNLGADEVNAILAETGQVQIHCNFCGKGYDFDAVDCAALFLEARDPIAVPGSDTRH
ncbi:Hsp33 family molecular chaperone HslO [Castellaniella sp.]|uniref:Hsp33 family molecular chaperone HslO n=1 Tax=Castellaniella sp. TaxID=1955812 RepID=UPI00355FA6E9